MGVTQLNGPVNDSHSQKESGGRGGGRGEGEGRGERERVTEENCNVKLAVSERASARVKLVVDFFPSSLRVSTVVFLSGFLSKETHAQWHGRVGEGGVRTGS